MRLMKKTPKPREIKHDRGLDGRIFGVLVGARATRTPAPNMLRMPDGDARRATQKCSTTPVSLKTTFWFLHSGRSPRPRARAAAHRPQLSARPHTQRHTHRRRSVSQKPLQQASILSWVVTRLSRRGTTSPSSKAERGGHRRLGRSWRRAAAWPWRAPSACRRSPYSTWVG